MVPRIKSYGGRTYAVSSAASNDTLFRLFREITNININTINISVIFENTHTRLRCEIETSFESIKKGIVPGRRFVFCLAWLFRLLYPPSGECGDGSTDRCRLPGCLTNKRLYWGTSLTGSSNLITPCLFGLWFSNSLPCPRYAAFSVAPIYFVFLRPFSFSVSFFPLFSPGGREGMAIDSRKEIAIDESSKQEDMADIVGISQAVCITHAVLLARFLLVGIIFFLGGSFFVLFSTYFLFLLLSFFFLSFVLSFPVSLQPQVVWFVHY